MQAPSGFKPFSETAGGMQSFIRHEADPTSKSKGRVHFGYRQDVSDFLDAQKARQVDAKGTFARKDCWGTHVACIPEIIQLQWFSEHGVTVWDLSDPDMMKKVMRLLDDPEWRYLRVELSRLT